VISALATIGSVIFAAILGQFFDGTILIMIFGVAVLAVLGAIVVHRLKRFERPHKA
jgi:DHA1 family bicyclomycin/chloramphenicol resistance-like MFS transporter